VLNHILPLRSSPVVDVRVTNYTWILNRPYDLFASTEKKYNLYFFILWKFIPMSEDKGRVLQETLKYAHFLMWCERNCVSFVIREYRCRKGIICVVIMKRCTKRSLVILTGRLGKTKSTFLYRTSSGTRVDVPSLINEEKQQFMQVLLCRWLMQTLESVKEYLLKATEVLCPEKK
jgi:hypothetical protein